MTTTDKENIYKELIDLLTSYCDTCLDKNRMDKILLSAFKLDLIEYAEENNTEDVESLWESLAKTLGVKSCSCTEACASNNCGCINVMCSLC